MLSKVKLLEAIQNMSEEKFANLDSVLEEIILMDKIENSMEAAARGDVLSEEEMDKLVDSW